MSKHTPGPWVAEVTKSDAGGWKPERQNVMITAGNILIAFYSTDYTEYPSDAENEANAKLIAAAPDLLEALELLAYPSMWTSKGNGETHIGWQPGDGLTANERLEKARAAIRKATE